MKLKIGLNHLVAFYNYSDRMEIEYITKSQMYTGVKRDFNFVQLSVCFLEWKLLNRKIKILIEKKSHITVDKRFLIELTPVQGLMFIMELQTYLHENKIIMETYLLDINTQIYKELLTLTPTYR